MGDKTKAFILGVAYAVATAFSAAILPVLSIGENLRHPVNLIWGFIYGFGWYAAGFVDDIRSPNIQLLGSLIWPFIVLLLATYWFRALLMRTSRTNRIALAPAVVSLFLVLPQRLISETWLKYIPVYSGILSAVY